MASTTLATRCPACQTVFRVVPDQLRVSQGWVRCGRCAEVFNATLSLVDIETGAPRQAAEVLSPSDLGIEVVAAHEDPTSTQPRAAEAEAETQALHAACLLYTSMFCLALHSDHPFVAASGSARCRLCDRSMLV